MQRRQDLEDLPAAQVDVKQRAVEAAALGVFKHLVDARQRTDHVAAEFLQDPLQFESNEPFVLGKKDTAAG